MAHGETQKRGEYRKRSIYLCASCAADAADRSAAGAANYCIITLLQKEGERERNKVVFEVTKT